MSTFSGTILEIQGHLESMLSVELGTQERAVETLKLIIIVQSKTIVKALPEMDGHFEIFI